MESPSVQTMALLLRIGDYVGRAVRPATLETELGRAVASVRQLYEAAANGADAVLVIVRALPGDQLSSIHSEALALDLDPLVEVHDADELERALELDAAVIGINNRDLDTQRVDIGTTFELMIDVPAGKTVVAESGISDPAELDEFERVGVDAVLIGEALMRSSDPEARTREFVRDEEGTREQQLP